MRTNYKMSKLFSYFPKKMKQARPRTRKRAQDCLRSRFPTCCWISDLLRTELSLSC